MNVGHQILAGDEDDELFVQPPKPTKRRKKPKTTVQMSVESEPQEITEMVIVPEVTIQSETAQMDVESKPQEITEMGIAPEVTVQPENVNPQVAPTEKPATNKGTLVIVDHDEDDDDYGGDKNVPTFSKTSTKTTQTMTTPILPNVFEGHAKEFNLLKQLAGVNSGPELEIPSNINVDISDKSKLEETEGTAGGVESSTTKDKNLESISKSIISETNAYGEIVTTNTENILEENKFSPNDNELTVPLASTELNILEQAFSHTTLEPSTLFSRVMTGENLEGIGNPAITTKIVEPQHSSENKETVNNVSEEKVENSVITSSTAAQTNDFSEAITTHAENIMEENNTSSPNENQLTIPSSDNENNVLQQLSTHNNLETSTEMSVEVTVSSTVINGGNLEVIGNSAIPAKTIEPNHFSENKETENNVSEEKIENSALTSSKAAETNDFGEIVTSSIENNLEKNNPSLNENELTVTPVGTESNVLAQALSHNDLNTSTEIIAQETVSTTVMNSGNLEGIGNSVIPTKTVEPNNFSENKETENNVSTEKIENSALTSSKAAETNDFGEIVTTSTENISEENNALSPNEGEVTVPSVGTESNVLAQAFSHDDLNTSTEIFVQKTVSSTVMNGGNLGEIDNSVIPTKTAEPNNFSENKETENNVSTEKIENSGLTSSKAAETNDFGEIVTTSTENILEENNASSPNEGEVTVPSVGTESNVMEQAFSHNYLNTSTEIIAQETVSTTVMNGGNLGGIANSVIPTKTVEPNNFSENKETENNVSIEKIENSALTSSKAAETNDFGEIVTTSTENILEENNASSPTEGVTVLSVGTEGDVLEQALSHNFSENKETANNFSEQNVQSSFSTAAETNASDQIITTKTETMSEEKNKLNLEENISEQASFHTNFGATTETFSSSATNGPDLEVVSNTSPIAAETIKATYFVDDNVQEISTTTLTEAETISQSIEVSQASTQTFTVNSDEEAITTSSSQNKLNNIDITKILADTTKIIEDLKTQTTELSLLLSIESNTRSNENEKFSTASVTKPTSNEEKLDSSISVSSTSIVATELKSEPEVSTSEFLLTSVTENIEKPFTSEAQGYEKIGTSSIENEAQGSTEMTTTSTTANVKQISPENTLQDVNSKETEISLNTQQKNAMTFLLVEQASKNAEEAKETEALEETTFSLVASKEFQTSPKITPNPALISTLSQLMDEASKIVAEVLKSTEPSTVQNLESSSTQELTSTLQEFHSSTKITPTATLLSTLSLLINKSSKIVEESSQSTVQEVTSSTLKANDGKSIIMTSAQLIEKTTKIEEPNKSTADNFGPEKAEITSKTGEENKPENTAKPPAPEMTGKSTEAFLITVTESNTESLDNARNTQSTVDDKKANVGLSVTVEGGPVEKTFTNLHSGTEIPSQETTNINHIGTEQNTLSESVEITEKSITQLTQIGLSNIQGFTQETSAISEKPDNFHSTEINLHNTSPVPGNILTSLESLQTELEGHLNIKNFGTTESTAESLSDLTNEFGDVITSTSTQLAEVSVNVPIETVSVSESNNGEILEKAFGDLKEDNAFEEIVNNATTEQKPSENVIVYSAELSTNVPEIVATSENLPNLELQETDSNTMAAEVTVTDEANLGDLLKVFTVQHSETTSHQIQTSALTDADVFSLSPAVGTIENVHEEVLNLSTVVHTMANLPENVQITQSPSTLNSLVNSQSLGSTTGSKSDQKEILSTQTTPKSETKQDEIHKHVQSTTSSNTKKLEEVFVQEMEHFPGKNKKTTICEGCNVTETVREDGSTSSKENKQNGMETEKSANILHGKENTINGQEKMVTNKITENHQAQSSSPTTVSVTESNKVSEKSTEKRDQNPTKVLDHASTEKLTEKSQLAQSEEPKKHTQQQATLPGRPHEEAAEQELKHFPVHEVSTICETCNKTEPVEASTNLSNTVGIAEITKTKMPEHTTVQMVEDVHSPKINLPPGQENTSIQLTQSQLESPSSTKNIATDIEHTSSKLSQSTESNSQATVMTKGENASHSSTKNIATDIQHTSSKLSQSTESNSQTTVMTKGKNESHSSTQNIATDIEHTSSKLSQSTESNSQATVMTKGKNESHSSTNNPPKVIENGLSNLPHGSESLVATAVTVGKETENKASTNNAASETVHAPPQLSKVAESTNTTNNIEEVFVQEIEHFPGHDKHSTICETCNVTETVGDKGVTSVNENKMTETGKSTNTLHETVNGSQAITLTTVTQHIITEKTLENNNSAKEGVVTDDSAAKGAEKHTEIHNLTLTTFGATDHNKAGNYSTNKIPEEGFLTVNGQVLEGGSNVVHLTTQENEDLENRTRLTTYGKEHSSNKPTEATLKSSANHSVDEKFHEIHENETNQGGATTHENEDLETHLTTYGKENSKTENTLKSSANHSLEEKEMEHSTHGIVKNTTGTSEKFEEHLNTTISKGLPGASSEHTANVTSKSWQLQENLKITTNENRPLGEEKLVTFTTEELKEVMHHTQQTDFSYMPEHTTNMINKSWQFEENLKSTTNENRPLGEEKLVTFTTEELKEVMHHTQQTDFSYMPEHTTNMINKSWQFEENLKSTTNENHPLSGKELMNTEESLKATSSDKDPNVSVAKMLEQIIGNSTPKFINLSGVLTTRPNDFTVEGDGREKLTNQSGKTNAAITSKNFNPAKFSKTNDDLQFEHTTNPEIVNTSDGGVIPKLSHDLKTLKEIFNETLGKIGTGKTMPAPEEIVITEQLQCKCFLIPVVKPALTGPHAIYVNLPVVLPNGSQGAVPNFEQYYTTQPMKENEGKVDLTGNTESPPPDHEVSSTKNLNAHNASAIPGQALTSYSKAPTIASLNLIGASVAPNGEDNNTNLSKIENTEITPSGITANPESTCNISDFTAKNHCICSVDSMIKDLRKKLSEKNYEEILANYFCPKLVNIEDGVVLENTSVPSIARLKRGLEMLLNLMSKRELVPSTNIEQFFNRDFVIEDTEYHLYAIPGMKIKIPCLAKGENMENQQNAKYSWTFGDGNPLTEGKVQESEGTVTIDNVMPQDGGNYTCTATSNSETGDVVKNDFQHQLSVITLPKYIVSTAILYNFTDKCKDEDTDIISLYFPNAFGEMLCGNDVKICSVEVQNPRCVQKANGSFIATQLSVSIEAMNVIFPSFNTTSCDVNCQIRTYAKIVTMIVKNTEILERLPVFFRLTYKQGKLMPTEPAEKKSKNDSITEAPQLLVQCSPGFGLIKQTHLCEACGRNTYSAGDESFCKTCPAGQYQPLVGSKSCLVCSSPLQDPFCLRVVYSNTAHFRLYVGIAVSVLILVLILICILKLKKKTAKANRHDKISSKNQQVKNRRHSRRRKDEDVEKQGDAEPLIKPSKKHKRGPQPPPPDFH